MSEETVVRQAAPTLAGVKTGSLFPYRCGSREELNSAGPFALAESPAEMAELILRM